MKDLFRKKTPLKLKEERFATLMRKSYKVSLKDPVKSDKLKYQASKIYKDIQRLSLKSAK